MILDVTLNMFNLITYLFFFTETGHKDLLTSLTTARNSEGSGLSDKELFGEIIGFLLAGFDVCSSVFHAKCATSFSIIHFVVDKFNIFSS